MLAVTADGLPQRGEGHASRLPARDVYNEAHSFH
jgi:hypothetical protein